MNQAQSNTPITAPRFANHENVARTTASHQAAAMHAAQMVSSQYTRAAKNKFKRECISHLKASLAVQELQA